MCQLKEAKCKNIKGKKWGSGEVVTRRDKGLREMISQVEQTDWEFTVGHAQVDSIQSLISS